MNNTLKFMLVLGNGKLIATSKNGRDSFYGKVSACCGRKPNLKKFAACLSSRI
ncbi:hypothetical protein [Candidatus Proelusimicrobium volucris]|uniref:hypothetical protein n=1 Tax=Candidatus Proelusimicrobium volucris TaxID=3416225 RepID=UPI003D139B82